MVSTNNPNLQGIADRLNDTQQQEIQEQKEAERRFREETESVCGMVSRARRVAMHPEYFDVGTMAELTVRAPAQTVVQVVESATHRRYGAVDFILPVMCLCIGAALAALVLL